MTRAMSDAAIKAALRAAAMHNCICYGECFETRHGMMHGPCEAELELTAAAIAAFLREHAAQNQARGWHEYYCNQVRDLARKVERAAGGGG
jgi:hypothetical protein